jgi:hypothetical protein
MLKNEFVFIWNNKKILKTFEGQIIKVFFQDQIVKDLGISQWNANDL